jgi:hypothetical protein
MPQGYLDKDDDEYDMALIRMMMNMICPLERLIKQSVIRLIS